MPSGYFFYSNSMHPGNYLSRHGDGCDLSAVKAALSDDNVVVKGTLDIVRWAESDGSYCAELYSIICGFVGLDIFTKL